MTEFEVVLRGYDRFAVDVLVQAVEAAAGDRDEIDAVIKEAGPLPMVLRGYAPAQVDAWLASRRAGDVGDRPAAAGGPAPAAGGPAPAAEPRAVEFNLVLRGYRVSATDALLATVAAAEASDDPARRAAALRAITEARLPVALRGYDRWQVDSHLERAAQALRTP
jgi:DivIVA domain-containing protein